MELISLTEAAALLQPALGNVNAFNLLADWRRQNPTYRDRIFSPPRYAKVEGRIVYPRSEILRVIREIDEKRRLPVELMV